MIPNRVMQMADRMAEPMAVVIPICYQRTQFIGYVLELQQSYAKPWIFTIDIWSKAPSRISLI